MTQPGQIPPGASLGITDLQSGHIFESFPIELDITFDSRGLNAMSQKMESDFWVRWHVDANFHFLYVIRFRKRLASIIR